MRNKLSEHDIATIAKGRALNINSPLWSNEAIDDLLAHVAAQNDEIAELQMGIKDDGFEPEPPVDVSQAMTTQEADQAWVARCSPEKVAARRVVNCDKCGSLVWSHRQTIESSHPESKLAKEFRHRCDDMGAGRSGLAAFTEWIIENRLDIDAGLRLLGDSQ